jgi:hypothetical protein
VVVVGPTENFEALRGASSSAASVESPNDPAERPGDRIIFYLTGVVQFGGIIEVTSTMFGV